VSDNQALMAVPVLPTMVLQPSVVHHQMAPTPVAVTTDTATRIQGGISLTRLFIAFCTFGLSLPFLGVRRVRKLTTTQVQAGVR
jgi:hypothetical protein